MNTEHEEFTALIIDNEMTAAEFKVATRTAIENMAECFDFYGYTVETTTAIEVVNDLESDRTYH